MAGNGRIYKVALFGAIGCGKSSIINLLADKQVAGESTGVEACTRRARWYQISLGEKEFRLWDTMGFSQPEAEDINPLSPYEQAYSLLRNSPDGVDLIFLCARKDGINTTLRNLYWLLDSFFFGGRAQIALVLTHFDSLSEQVEWWDRNMNAISQRCNIPVRFLPHACITTVHNGSSEFDPVYQRSKQELEALLEDVYDATPTSFLLDLTSGSATVAMESLNTHCQLNVADAATLVDRFRSPKRPFNAVLFGEAGAGKSSVINLLTGSPVAKVSSRMNSCTLDFCGHEVSTKSHQFRVWDTVGLNGMYIGHDVCGRAIENAVRLIRTLHRQGGIDLLVFCKRSGRFSPSELNSFRLFFEFLCEGKIPVAFIITHLEFLSPMEEWWENNGAGLLQVCNLKPDAVAGHACITALATDTSNDQKLHDKLSLSKQLVQTMLEDSISYGDAYDKDEETWVISFLKKFVRTINVGNPSRKERVTIKNFMDRCGLSKGHAEELTRSLYARG